MNRLNNLMTFVGAHIQFIEEHFKTSASPPKSFDYTVKPT